MTWMAMTVGILGFAQRESDAMFDHALRELAHVALALSSHEIEEIVREGRRTLDEEVEEATRGDLVYQIWRGGRTLAYRSLQAPDFPLTSGRSGFEYTTLLGQRLRAYTEWNSDHSVQVQMALFPQRPGAYSAKIYVFLCLALSATFVVFLVFIRRRMAMAFAPLNATVATLRQRPDDDPWEVDSPSDLSDLSSIVGAFNRLIERVDRAARREQRLTSDAAHILRTPLAALSILARNAEFARSDEERVESFKAMGQVIDRTTGLVEGLFIMANLDRRAAGAALDERIDVADLARRMLTEAAPVILARGLHVVWLPPPSAATVSGNRQLLGLALRNLFDHAALRLPPSAEMALQVVVDESSMSLELQCHDSGPALSEALRLHAFDHFSDASEASSLDCGTGLALTARIASLHGGSAYLSFSERLGGMLSALRLPLASAAAR